MKKFDTLPDIAKEEIMRISKKEQSKERQQKRFIELITAYSRTFEEMVNDDQFKDDMQMHKYITAIIRKRYGLQKPSVERIIVPIGTSGVQHTSSGKLSNVFILDKEDDFKKIRLLLLKGEAAEQCNEITYDYKYTVEVGVFDDNKTLISSRFLDFSSPGDVDIVSLRKALAIDKITIATVNNNISKTTKSSDGKEYPIKTDWKCIKGMIVRKSKGNRKTGKGEWGLYVITDMSVDDRITLNDGTVIERTLTLWTDPSIMHYPEESLCNFYGPTSKYEDKDGVKKLSFSCYMIEPLMVAGAGEE